MMPPRVLAYGPNPAGEGGGEGFNTVKLLLSGPLLSDHLLLNGHLSNSQKAVPLLTVNLTPIKQPPLF